MPRGEGAGDEREDRGMVESLREIATRRSAWQQMKQPAHREQEHRRQGKYPQVGSFGRLGSTSQRYSERETRQCSQEVTERTEGIADAKGRVGAHERGRDGRVIPKVTILCPSPLAHI